MITAKQLKAVAPQAKVSLDQIAKAMNLLFPIYNITTNLRVQHFIAQAAHETAGFKTLREYWGPTKAQKGYEGRSDLGNTKPGDGKRFMGRGIFQLTGRANYKSIGKKLGLPLESQPELAAQPYNSVAIACEYWKSRKINAKADQDDLEGVTRLINGGLNGLADRRNYLKWAKSLVRWSPVAKEQPEAPIPIPSEKPTGSPPLAHSEGEPQPEAPLEVVLTPNSGRELIAPLQRLLTEKNYGKLNPDGLWGPLTSMAVTALQTANNLPLNAKEIKWADAQAAKVFIAESRADMTIAEVRQTETEAATELNNTTLVKGGGAVVAGVTAGNETGFFKWVGDATEKFTILQPAIEALSKAWEFAANNIGWVAVAGGVAVFFIARNSEFKIFNAFKRGD